MLWGFFSAALLAGILGYRTVGISADEPSLYTSGVQEYAYLFMGGPQPAVQDWQFHNPFVHMLLFAAQRVLGIEAAQSIWLFRHFLLFLLFLAAVRVLYSIGAMLFEDWIYACIAAVFLFLSPRVFLQAFHNPKDMPALAFFTFAMWSLFQCRKSGYSLGWLSAHALLCALAVGLRPFAFLLPLFTIAAVVLDKGLSGRSWRQCMIVSATFLVLFWILLIASWPLLWSHPVTHLLSAFADNTTRAAGGLYMGHMVTQLPWHYAPVWILITTPLLYSALFLVGLGNTVYAFLKQPSSVLHSESSWLFIGGWILLPYLALVLLHMGIFDEWRHLLFLYPAFVLFAVRGLHVLWNIRQLFLKKALLSLCCLSLVWTAVWMTVNHPHEFAYFSIPSSLVRGNFDLDYWSLSYRDGIEWVLAHDKRPAVPLYTASRVGYVNGDLFPRAEWERLRFVSASSADYLLDNYRWNGYAPAMGSGRLLYGVTVDGLLVHGVYKGPDTDNVYSSHAE